MNVSCYPAVGDNFSALVGENIRTIMDKNKIKNPEMAELLNLSVAQVKRIKRGTSLLKAEHAWIICKKYDVSMDRLYNLRMDIELIPTAESWGDDVGITREITIEDSMQNVVVLIDQAPTKSEKKRLFKYAERVLSKEGHKLMD